MNTKRRSPLFWVCCVFLMTSLLGGCWCVGIVPPAKFPPPEGPKEGKLKDGTPLTDASEVIPEEPVTEPDFNPDEVCVDGDTRYCKTGEKGVCSDGQRLCVNGKWSACKRLTEPSAEICDNKDNDCDGQTDETLVRECPYTGPAGTKGVGPCKAGSQTCSKGEWGKCTGEIKPKKEECDGKDNDCDGAIDEWLPVQQAGVARIYSTNGDPTHIHMVAIPGGYAFAWSEYNASQRNQRVLLTRLKSDGARWGTDTILTKSNAKGNVHGAAWTGKELLICWDTDDYDAATGNQTANALINRFSADGKLVQGPVTLAIGGRMVNPQVAVGPGFYGVVWSDFNTQELYAQTLDTSLNPLGQAKSFKLNKDSSPYPGVAFSGDRMGVAFVTGDRKVKFAVFDKKTTQIGKTLVLNNAGSSPADATLSGLSNGFLVVWNDRANGGIYIQKVDRTGNAVGARQTILKFGGFTPIIKGTTFGGMVAWVERRTGRDGISIVRVDQNGKPLATPSWFAVAGVEQYLALAWTDEGKGQGRGAIGWINKSRQIFVAPLGCAKK